MNFIQGIGGLSRFSLFVRSQIHPTVVATEGHMAIQPLELVEAVVDEYRDHLETEFRARDPKLQQALVEALDREGFLAQEPFFQSYRPFKAGTAWKELGLDPNLAEAAQKRADSKVAYKHQSDAIAHLLAPQPSPLVVTTGTGSGKTECFLIPALHNAIRDSVEFKKPGLTAILVYPMNALANDQEKRIEEYLRVSGHEHVRVARYDRSTSQKAREEMRANPPHIMLTNYVMLEYLLVRPADREALFTNHRCRFLVLDEVHTYRGALGANLALLIRRVQAHLRAAIQDWRADVDAKLRFPGLTLVGTSATIKSVSEEGLSPEELRARRDVAVQEFFGTLTGAPAKTVRVLGEEYGELTIPSGIQWSKAPMSLPVPGTRDRNVVGATLAALAGLPTNTPTEEAIRKAAVLWELNRLLARKPLSLTRAAQAVIDTIPDRKGADLAAVREEVHTALHCGASLFGEGAVALRAHRFIRGGWHFHRCVDPECGRLYPMGEELCECGQRTAPLRICRSCGTDVLGFVGQQKPEDGPLDPRDGEKSEARWYLYRWTPDLDPTDESPDTMKERAVAWGSFDPKTCLFSPDKSLLPVPVALAPETNVCIHCGYHAGAGSILTRVAMGTSAAVRVIAESLVENLDTQHRREPPPNFDKKERLLVFSDSRQDAAHQARFINYAGRYDRMRRRVLGFLTAKKAPATVHEVVEHLYKAALDSRDNPQLDGIDSTRRVPAERMERARAWEEAPLLDDLAVSPGYRATLFNLSLVGVRYEGLAEDAKSPGGVALAKKLALEPHKLEYVARCILDEMRMKRALARPMLQYHPKGASCPDAFRTGVADWERRYPYPLGFAAVDGKPVGRLDTARVQDGIDVQNIWGDPSRGTRTRLRRRFSTLMKSLRGEAPTEELLLDLVNWLMPTWLKAYELHGWRKSTSLLQLNPEAVQLELLQPGDRYRCTVCNTRKAWAFPEAPCTECGNPVRPLTDKEVEASRYVRRLRESQRMNLVAREHTAQVTSDDRILIEENFKGTPETSPVNVLSCSPTLEMGVDVGGLDAVVMRNVPPRPDNYAQRGGRAGRRTRVGVVLGFARNRPHDQYFFEKPEEMISGEVPAPVINLANRDVLLRHLAAINLSLAEPGLAGRLSSYVTTMGDFEEPAIQAFEAALAGSREKATRVAIDAWGWEILKGVGLDSEAKILKALESQAARVRTALERVQFQVQKLQQTVDTARQAAQGEYKVMQAFDLIRRILGVPSSDRHKQDEADDRGTGHPMRRFAEEGVLPGYEFPSEPATLRLVGDDNEDEPITVTRRFGLAQYQPGATAYARGHRWEVIGLDTTSPWNPRDKVAQWVYTRCSSCDLRFSTTEHTKCPRCATAAKGLSCDGWEFAGYLARRADTPVLDEEDRFALSSLLRVFPQWDGQVVMRASLPTGWLLELRRDEEIRWLNEWKPPTSAEKASLAPQLHEEGRGFYICQSCGRLLKWVAPDKKPSKKPKKGGGSDDHFEHAPKCELVGKPPTAKAITTKMKATTLRLTLDLPSGMSDDDWLTWGHSIGASLRRGLRTVYALDGSEVEYELEPTWDISRDGHTITRGSLLFLDGAVGGSGFLERAIGEFNAVAKAALNHLEHADCDTACYRCLKSYDNQRFHKNLSWARVWADLQELAAEPPKALAGDTDPTAAWREAFAAGVGSPLELRFLKLFEQYGLQVDKQVEVGPEGTSRPISTADFVVKGTRVALYVDGAAFHAGERRRRDLRIRERLQQGGWWKVETLRAVDLKDGAELVERLRSISAPA